MLIAVASLVAVSFVFSAVVDVAPSCAQPPAEVYPSMLSVLLLYLTIPTEPDGRCPVVPFGSLIALVTADTSNAVVAFIVIMVLPSAAIVIAPVPESVTVTFEFPCDTELVDIVVKLKVPLPSVFITCPALPSDVG